jgi:hypothetical protein
MLQQPSNLDPTECERTLHPSEKFQPKLVQFLNEQQRRRTAVWTNSSVDEHQRGRTISKSGKQQFPNKTVWQHATQLLILAYFPQGLIAHYPPDS